MTVCLSTQPSDDVCIAFLQMPTSSDGVNLVMHYVFPSGKLRSVHAFISFLPLLTSSPMHFSFPLPYSRKERACKEQSHLIIFKCVCACVCVCCVIYLLKPEECQDDSMTKEQVVSPELKVVSLFVPYPLLLLTLLLSPILATCHFSSLPYPFLSLTSSSLFLPPLPSLQKLISLGSIW